MLNHHLIFEQNTKSIRDSKNLESLSEEELKKLEEIVKSKVDLVGSHGWKHIKRVHDLCVYIAEREGANMAIVRAAALLHDVVPARKGHVAKSARVARVILKDLKLPEKFVEKVVDAIASHGYREGGEPDSLEAKVLWDADKLDAIGAIGIYRVSVYSAEQKRDLRGMLKHFEDKLLKLKDLLYTDTARKLAEARHELTEGYVRRLKEELSFFGEL